MKCAKHNSSPYLTFTSGGDNSILHCLSCSFPYAALATLIFRMIFWSSLVVSESVLPRQMKFLYIEIWIMECKFLHLENRRNNIHLKTPPYTPDGNSRIRIRGCLFNLWRLDKWRNRWSAYFGLDDTLHPIWPKGRTNFSRIYRLIVKQTSDENLYHGIEVFKSAEFYTQYRLTCLATDLHPRKDGGDQ